MVIGKESHSYLAKVKLFGQGEGGRSSPYSSNCVRIGVVFESNDEALVQYGAIMRVSTRSIPLGEEFGAEFQFLAGKEVELIIRCGDSFKVHEGQRVIGRGTWA